MTEIAVKVVSKDALARDIVRLRLVPFQPSDSLPAFDAGAHIEVRLSNGMMRSYSLTNLTEARGGNPRAYEIAVGRDANSRGGSQAIHDVVHVGSRVGISAPRNHFKLNPTHGRVLLLAGGIGVTPIYAMAQELLERGVPFELVYCARSAARMAYLEELRALCGDNLRTHADDEAGAVLDVPGLLKARQWDGLYVCGPAPLLDLVTAATVDWPDGSVVMERFTAPDPVLEPGTSFTLVLAQTGLETTVSPDESVLDAIERLGVAHPFSCREGICGTCESRVVAGHVDHRCAVLSQVERDSQTVMMPCVSRCTGERLTLDL